MIPTLTICLLCSVSKRLHNRPRQTEGSLLLPAILKLGFIKAFVTHRGHQLYLSWQCHQYMYVHSFISCFHRRDTYNPCCEQKFNAITYYMLCLIIAWLLLHTHKKNCSTVRVFLYPSLSKETWQIHVGIRMHVVDI